MTLEIAGCIFAGAAGLGLLVTVFFSDERDFWSWVGTSIVLSVIGFGAFGAVKAVKWMWEA